MSSTVSTVPDRALLRSIRAAPANRPLAAIAAALLAVLALAGNAKLAIAQDDLNAQNFSSIVKNVKASEGSTVTINIAGADCSGDSGAKLRVTYYWLDDAAT